MTTEPTATKAIAIILVRDASARHYYMVDPYWDAAERDETARGYGQGSSGVVEWVHPCGPEGQGTVLERAQARAARLNHHAAHGAHVQQPAPVTSAEAGIAAYRAAAQARAEAEIAFYKTRAAYRRLQGDGGAPQGSLQQLHEALNTRDAADDALQRARIAMEEAVR